MESCCDCCCCLDVEPTSVATCKRYVHLMETLCRDWQCSRLCQRWRISLWKTSSSNADRFINCFYEVFSISYMVLYRCLISQAHAKEILLSSQKSRVVELPHPFCLASSVLWCWSWEKEGRAVEVVPGIYAVHWKFSVCTATRTSSYSPVGPSVFFVCVHI